VIASACLFILTSAYFSGIPSSLDQANHYTTADIPRSIWQIYMYSEPPDDGILEHVNTWSKLNPDFSHHRLSNADAIEFVSRHYAHRPDLVDLYTNLKPRSLKSDLLRYMILATEGGVCADSGETYKRMDSEAVPPYGEGGCGSRI